MKVDHGDLGDNLDKWGDRYALSPPGRQRRILSSGPSADDPEDDGTLHVAGRIAENAQGPDSFTLVSGTGAYAGVAGQASVVELDDTHSTITLRYTVAALTQVSSVPVGGASAGGGPSGGGTDSALLIGVGIAAVVGSIGLFAAAHAAARRN